MTARPGGTDPLAAALALAIRRAVARRAEEVAETRAKMVRKEDQAA